MAEECLSEVVVVETPVRIFGRRIWAWKSGTFKIATFGCPTEFDIQHFDTLESSCWKDLDTEHEDLLSTKLCKILSILATTCSIILLPG